MTNKEKIKKYFDKHHLVSGKDLVKYFIEINKATVYRNIKKLLEEKSIREVETIHNEIYYESTSHKHHGHFICTECGDAEELKVEKKTIEKIRSTNNINQEDVQLNIKGKCQDCN